MTHQTTILLVEDQADIRELFTLVLASAGYHVIAAADAQIALDMLATHAVDLLVTDYQMPKMNGSTLISMARMRQPSLRAILTSGQPEIEALATACRAHAWYRKGTPLEELVAIVATTLHGQASSRGDALCCA
jgi:DNA-binding NtrC family response regulator